MKATLTAKTKTPSRANAKAPAPMPQSPPWQTPPWTREESLQRIQSLGQRVSTYVEFMCAIGGLGGTSAEAKDKAIAAFYEQLTFLEGELGRIKEELQLG